MADQQQLTVGQFAAKVRAKYPGAYDSVSDSDLTQKVLAKFPDYAPMVNINAPEPLKGATFAERLRNASNPSSFEGKPENVGQYVPESGGQVLSGLGDILHGDFARGGHKIISGIGVATLPAAPFGIMAAPIPAAIGMGGGMVGGTIAQKGAQALGATPDQQALAGDIGGLAGGIAAPQATAALRAGASRALLLGKTPEGAYESALKPSTVIPAAKRAQIVATGLQEGIPVSKAGAEKLQALIDDVNSQIGTTIATNPTAPIPRAAATRYIPDLKAKFSQQVSPTADLNAIDATVADFTASHPATLPAETAQLIKQGTYARIGDRAYGEVGTATTEAEKALARGLKDELVTAFPELKELNARDSTLYGLQPVIERAVSRIGNHQLLGIGTPIAVEAGGMVGGKGMAGTAGFVKAVLDNPNVKSRLAIGLMKSGISAAAANQRVDAYIGALAQQSVRGYAASPDSSQRQ